MGVYGPVRFSFLQVFEPKTPPGGSKPKYSVCCMIPKADTKLVRRVQEDVQAAIEKAIADGTFAKNKVATLKLPVRDGSVEYNNGEGSRGSEFDGMFFFNANSDNQPGLIDGQHNPILEKNELFSGCWGYVDCNFYGYNVGTSTGIAAGLNNLMKWKEDSRLDGRKSANEAFANVDLPAVEGEME